MTLLNLLAHESFSNLALALLHSFWQGLLIAGVLYAFLQSIPTRWTNLRYGIAVGSLLLTVFAVLITWSILNSPAQSPAISFNRESIPWNESVHQALAVPKTLLFSSTTEAIVESPSSSQTEEMPWTAWVLLAWLGGVSVMLIRLSKVVYGVRRIRLGGQPLYDERFIALVESLCNAMRVTRRIQIIVSDSLRSPAVIGIVWPTLLLPASILSGLPLETVRAILAHEIAHIRRWDYLVNLIQMVLESLLFFNPAVWWINRQIRIEREACCDACAIPIAGGQSEYLLALAYAIQQSCIADAEFQPTLSFAGTRNPSDLLERLRRIVHPDQCRSPFASWPSLLGLVLVAALALACLKKGVDYVAENLILTPERIAQMEEIEKTHGLAPKQEYGNADRITVTGKVRTEDSSPLPASMQADLNGFDPNNPGQVSLNLSVTPTGQFTGTLEYKPVIHVFVNVEGYAPFVSQALNPKPGEALSLPDCVLRKGFEGRVRFVNPEGNPIPNVRISANSSFSFGHSRGSTRMGIGKPHEFVSDERSETVIPHCSDLQQSLTVIPDGYQHEEDRITLKPNETYTWILQPSRPVTGIVVSKVTGQPIAGAELRSWEIVDKNSTHRHDLNSTNEYSAQTDEKGRFVLSFLRDDVSYTYIVMAPRYAWGLLENLRAGAENQRIELYPPIQIKGKILGTPEQLDRIETVEYSQIKRYGRFEYSYTHPSLNYWIRDDMGHFEIDSKIWPGFLNFRIGEKELLFNVSKSIEEVTIDLTAGEPVNDITRTVFFRLKRRADLPPPKGNLDVVYSRFSETTHAFLAGGEKNLPIIDDEARMDIPVPGRVTCTAKGFVGYWLDTSRMDTIVIDKGNTPYIIQIDAHPAGSIYGSIAHEDGSNPGGVMLKVQMMDESSLLLNFITTNNQQSVHSGSYVYQSLPLGHRYKLIAYRGNYYTISDLIYLSAKNPIQKFDVVWGEGTTVTGRVLTPGNIPMVDIELTPIVQINGQVQRISLESIKTDMEGNFQLNNINPYLKGDYYLAYDSPKEFRSFHKKIDAKSQPMIVHLQKGLTASGVILDQETEYPVPGVWVMARPLNSDSPLSVNSEQATNLKGEFTFTNLEEGDYYITLSSHGIRTPEVPIISFTAGQTNPITVWVIIPEDSPIKARKPD